MEIRFTRTGDRTSHTLAQRDDGVSVHVPRFDRKFPLPHDLAHYVVERECGLTHGFWGCVAEGALFPGMSVVAGRQRPHAAEHSRTLQRTWHEALGEAELVVAALLELHRGKRWSPLADLAAKIDPALRHRVLARLEAEQRRWQALEVGEHLAFAWPRADERGRARPSSRGR
jgi:hypothetical protein